MDSVELNHNGLHSEIALKQNNHINYTNNSSNQINDIISFKWQEVTLNDILRAVIKLSNSKCEDYFGFSNAIIKSIIDVIAQPLMHLINWMIKDKIFPDCLKIAKTIPVYKNGDRKCPNNYRPLSIVPIIAKIIEDCMKTQLANHITGNNLMNRFQYGFSKGNSTSKAVETAVSNILENFEQGLMTCATLLDLSKAFDTVPHNILLTKLERYGIRGEENKLMKSYLNDRYQAVKVSNKISNLCKIKTGVAQGSILGPYLFLIYINDITEHLPCKSVIYADDITLLISDKNINSIKTKNEEALEMATNWLHLNKLMLNRDKTENILFHLNNKEHDITDSKKVKLLGIYLDNKLSWKEHTQQLCKKLARSIYILRKLKNVINDRLILTAYYAFFHTHLTYGVTLWGNATGAKEVFKWQKKAIRCIMGKAEMESCRPLFKELRVMTLPAIYIYYTLIRTKEDISQFPIRGDVHTHNTRNRNTIDTPQVRLTKTQVNYGYNGQRIFNKLPQQIRNMTMNHFKKYLKQWLTENCIYTIDEFVEKTPQLLEIE